MIPCPPSEVLVALADGSLSEGGRPALLEHLESCEDCRRGVSSLVHALRAGKAPATTRKSWVLPLAAAAALLLAFLLLPGMPGRPGEGGKDVVAGGALPPPAASTPFPASSRCGIVSAVGEDLALPLGASALLTLREGARADLGPGRVLWLGGDLGIETRGDALEVRCGEAQLLLEDADACLISAPAGWSLVPQAHAAAGEARRVVLLRGSGRLRLADRTYPLSEGQEVDLANPSSPRPATEPAWGPRAGWQRVPGLPLRVHDAARELGEAGAAGSGAGFLWEALVRRTQASARFGVIWASGDHHDEGWEVPLGAEVLGTGEGWVRLRLERRRGWVRLTAGALEILSCPEDQSSRRAYPRTPPRSAGILVSGGDVEVLEARWKKVPE